MIAFLTATFLSAFLLFQVQPVIARYILPLYGGSPSLWTASMMFFQVSLLLGYLYAHILGRQVAERMQPVVHLALLAVSLLLLPIGPPDDWVPNADWQPGVEILGLLALSVGGPFILIAASGPLLQRWYAGVYPDRSPFRLYALSNLGSLVGLLSYPFLIEPQLRLDSQTLAWSVGYVGLVGLFAACGLTFRNKPAGVTSHPLDAGTRPASVADRLLWVALAACGSVLLLAVTNRISQDIAVVPFLWVLPLSIYLVSFIISFERDAWYRRRFWWPLLAVALALLLSLMFEEFRSNDWTLIEILGVYCLTLFACCMVCHGELARSRSSVAELTTFYLYVALGGALGGAFVNLVAPGLFDGYWELHVGIVATVILAGICLARDNPGLLSGSRRLWFAGGWLLTLVALAVLLVLQIRGGRDEAITVTRGFFGVLYVDEWNVGTPNYQRGFYHGTIQHGSQLMHPLMNRRPTTYYGVDSGVAAALRQHPRRQASDPAERGINIGIVGMGVGTLSVYGTEFDTMVYYEINPQVPEIAREYFRFLDNGAAETSVVLGDARLSMQRELEESGSRQFDVLVLDAFSGDSIPIHLLTEEAFDLYLEHLRPGGVLAIHISNQFVDLAPVVRTAARRIGFSSMLVEDSGERGYEDANDWVLLTDNEAFLSAPAVLRVQSEWWEGADREIHWSDDFSNLFEVVYWNE